LQLGHVFVYYGSADGLPATPSWEKTSGQDMPYSDYFHGTTAGDVNGDGYDDMIVGEYQHDNYRGRALLFFGSPTGLQQNAAWTFTGTAESSKVGFTVASAGDVNSDGFADIAIGNANGIVQVFHGSTNGLSPLPDWSYQSDQTGTHRFGSEVNGAGDVNGDGYADLMVGGGYYKSGEDQEGRAFLFAGSPQGLSPVPVWFSDGNQVLALFGISVAGAGDVNHDGVSDVIVGAQLFDDPEVDEGAVFAFQGRRAGSLAALQSPADAAIVKQGRLRAGYHLTLRNGAIWAIAATSRDASGDQVVTLRSGKQLRVRQAEIANSAPVQARPANRTIAAPAPRAPEPTGPRPADAPLPRPARFIVTLRTGEIIEASIATRAPDGSDYAITDCNGGSRRVPVAQVVSVTPLFRSGSPAPTAARPNRPTSGR